MPCGYWRYLSSSESVTRKTLKLTNVIFSFIFRFSIVVFTVMIAMMLILIGVIIIVVVIGIICRHVHRESIFDIALFIFVQHVEFLQSEKLEEDKS